MKIIIKSLCNLLWWIVVLTVGIIYSVLYFIWDPKAMIKEKKSHRTYIGLNQGIDWHQTLSDEDFWCPFINS